MELVGGRLGPQFGGIHGGAGWQEWRRCSNKVQPSMGIDVVV